MALKGIKVIEFAGLAPAPFCGMVLADFGANVTRIGRVDGNQMTDSLSRGKRSISLDLKCQTGVDVVKKMCRRADVLLEPFRPGVMEKLGLGPSILLADNPRLIYARLTGYGQEGPYKNLAGHDLNYLAVSGVLSHLGRHGKKPTPPVNLLADFAGGGLTCALGIVLALLERKTTDLGQVIDANMVEGAAYVSSFLFTSRKDHSLWSQKMGKNLLDGGSPFYDSYETSDNKYVAVACLEPQFMQRFLSILKLDVDPSNVLPGGDGAAELKGRLASIFKTRSRDDWATLFAQSDCCVTPVLDAQEAATDPHNLSRGSFFGPSDGGYVEPAPAPRLSAAPTAIPYKPARKPFEGEHTREVLRELNYDEKQIDMLIKQNVVACVTAKAKI